MSSDIFFIKESPPFEDWAVFGHAFLKRELSICRNDQRPSQSLTYRQSINQPKGWKLPIWRWNWSGFVLMKVYNGSLCLIDWFNPPSGKLPHGDDFRVGPKRWPDTVGQCSISALKWQKSYAQEARWPETAIGLKKGRFHGELCVPKILTGRYERLCGLPLFQVTARPSYRISTLNYSNVKNDRWFWNWLPLQNPSALEYCLTPLWRVPFSIHSGIIPVGQFSRKCANQSIKRRLSL